MAPEANRFNSFLRILENAISSGKNKQRNKKATRAWLQVYRKTHENTAEIFFAKDKMAPEANPFNSFLRCEVYEIIHF